jgi:hypothetical protein
MKSVPILRFPFCQLLLVFISIFIGRESSVAQGTQNYWPILAKLTYKKEYDALLGIKVDKPVFSSELRALEGKVIRLKGYIIPTDGYKSHKEFVFSAFPYSSCFFCGAAGPETVLEVMARQAIPYTSEPIEIQGVLHLNSKDINRLMFQLTEVEKVGR